MNRFSTLTFCFILLVIIGGCANKKEYRYEQLTKANPDSFQRESFAEYRQEDPVLSERVASGYLFSISHSSDSALSGKYRVNWNGDLYLPYKIKINAKNKTISNLIKEIKSRYEKYFSSDSDKVKVNLIQRRYYLNVTGLVKKPGKILVRSNTTMDEILGQVGGILPEQKNEFTSILVENKSKKLKVEIPYLEYIETGNPKLFPYWEGSEEIFIRKIGSRDQKQRDIILVTGEVRAPKEIPFEQDGDIYYYITKAGGFTNTANLRKVEIQRGRASKLKKIEFNLEELESIPVIYPGDRLIIHTEKPEFWEKVLDKIVDFSTILTAIAFIIIAI